MTSMTQRYGDHRSKAEALKMMLADVMMETGLIHSYSRLDNNNTNNNKDDEGYMGRLKRSVLSESWAAVDYDSRHHHAYCEVSIFTTIYYLLSTIYYLLSTTAPTTHIHIYPINGVVSILLSAAAGSDRQISRGGGRAALPGVYVPREEPSTQAPL